MKYYFKLLRPKHYIKNLIIFIPLVFAGKLLNAPMILSCLGAFAVFSLISSVIYIINDLRDVEKDRQHPTKRNRPIASGKVKPAGAITAAAIILVLSVVIGILCRFGLAAWLILGVYFALNLAYSLGLKRIPILDVTILALGYILRLMLGGAVTGIEISGWLYLGIISVSYYMGLGKRRNEMRSTSTESREVLRHYNYSFLDKSMQMFLTLAIVFYSLWAVSAEKNMLWTIPLVICIALKYSLTVEGDSDGDPVEVILRDKILILLASAYAALVVWLIYI